SVPLEPQNLRSDRLRGQRVAATVEKHLRPDCRRQVIDLAAGTRIDAVEDGVHQRLAGRIDGKHARPDGTGADRLYVTGADLAVGEELVADESEILPPILARAMLGP